MNSTNLISQELKVLVDEKETVFKKFRVGNLKFEIEIMYAAGKLATDISCYDATGKMDVATEQDMAIFLMSLTEWHNEILEYIDSKN